MLQPEDSNEEPEVISVNSVFEMHRLLAQPGAMEKVLGTVRAVRPRIVTVVEQEGNHNSDTFLDRFTEHYYYSTMFDSWTRCTTTPPCSIPSRAAAPAAHPKSHRGAAVAPAAAGTDQVMSEVYLGRQICNVVACEGAERTERHETLGPSGVAGEEAESARMAAHSTSPDRCGRSAADGRGEHTVAAAAMAADGVQSKESRDRLDKCAILRVD